MKIDPQTKIREIEQSTFWQNVKYFGLWV